MKNFCAVKELFFFAFIRGATFTLWMLSVGLGSPHQMIYLMHLIYKLFWSVKSDKCAHMMSVESESVWAEDCKFENEKKNTGM